jgi:hypothetical protein
VHEIPPNEIEYSRLSLIDDIGRVFRWQGHIYRAIPAEGARRVQEMFDSGLLDSLYSEGLTPSSTISDHSLAGYSLVLKHETIPRQSYPHEWSFEMFRDAAIVTLKVARIASSFGYQIKDCHPYNVMFYGIQPLFVDLGSLVQQKAGEAFIPNEIKYAFFYPLATWSKCSAFLARRIINSVTLPTSVCLQCECHLGMSSLSSSRTIWLRIKDLAHRLGGSPLRKLYRSVVATHANQPSAIDVINQWQEKMEGIAAPQEASAWQEYHNEYFVDGKLRTTERFDRLLSIVEDLNCETVVDLAGNQGLFSLALLSKTKLKQISCVDSDANAIDKLYRHSKQHLSDIDRRRIFPAVVDMMIPEMNYFTPLPSERLQSEIVLALAVTHHLLLGNRFRIDFVFQQIAEFTSKYAVIEFMPLGLWDGRSAQPRPDWYNEEWFVAGFRKYFDVMLREKIEENRIVFVGKKIVSH